MTTAAATIMERDIEAKIRHERDVMAAKQKFEDARRELERLEPTR